MHQTARTDVGDSASLEPRTEFPAFPYPPYNIQVEFMQSLYDLLRTGGVGFFESPTGTGKTMSLICSTLQWLQDWHQAAAWQAQQMEQAQQAQLTNHAQSSAGDDDDAGVPDWLKDAFQERAAAALAAAAAPTALVCAHASSQSKRSRVKPPCGSTVPVPAGQEDLAEFVLADVNPDDIAPATEDLAHSSSDDSHASIGEEEPQRKRPQVIFCSRTHSQLSQFIGELHKTSFADTMSVVALASRKVLCVHDPVLRLGSNHRINEACLDLQTRQVAKKVKARDGLQGQAAKAPWGRARRAKGRCPFLSIPQKSMSLFRELVLTEAMDIEGLVSSGRKRVACPYYAVRAAAPQADVVVAPYSALIHADTRKSLGVEVKGAVVIFDEGHNIVDAVNGSNSASVTGRQLCTAQTQIERYFMRFKSLLAPANARQIQLLLKILKQLSSALQPSAVPAAGSHASGGSSNFKKLVTFSEFLISQQLDSINLFQVLSWVRELKVVMKVSGYAGQEAEGEVRMGATRAAGEQGSVPDGEGNLAALHACIAFISSLTSTDADGRILVCGPSRESPSGMLRMVLLDAASRFSQAVKGAHAIVLASGTLSPAIALRQQLFPDSNAERFVLFSCGHVVPPEQLAVLSIGRGPSDIHLDLRHENRSKPAVMTEIGVLLQNICRLAHGGLIVFAPSNSFLDQLCNHWQTSGQLTKFEAVKQVFREPATSQGVEPILAQFAAACEQSGSQHSGAMLLAVVGGKLAEGINFGDDLGRCVVMLGLPFPNPSDVELRARMSYMDELARHPGSSQRLTGAIYYENLCFKAVNQCIGRVIRHKDDYAAIVLVDSRYTAIVPQATRASTMEKLPRWMHSSTIQTNGTFGPAFSQLQRFFRCMKSRTAVVP